MVCLTLGSSAQALEPNDSPADTARRAIVVLEGEPLATWRAAREQLAQEAGAASADERAYAGHLAASQAVAERALAASLPALRVEHRFTELLSGLAVSVPEAAWPALEAMAGQAGIRAIYAEETYSPSLYASVDVMGATALWPSLGGRDNAGAGVRIAVLDSGIRVDHPMFSAAGMRYPAGYPKGDSRYTTAKVIAARAYFRSGDAPLATETTPVPGASGSAHGTALASVAAGRQVQATVRGLTQTISGVAPGAYLMNYRIFYPSTSVPGEVAYTTEILQALEDAVADGAHVLLLGWASLSTASPLASALTPAIQAAVQAGCVVVAPSGNDGPSFSSASKLPGGLEPVITVGAHSKNRVLAYDHVDLVSPQPVPPDTVSQPFARALFGPAITATMGPLPYKDVRNVAAGGSGTACAPLPANSLRNALVVVSRGDCTFADKVYRAQQAGAVGVLVINDTDGVEEMGCSGDHCGAGAITIPAIMVGRTYGQRLLAWLAVYPDATLTIDPNARIVSITGDVIANISGRGPAFARYLKPDVLAPGVEILAASYQSGGAMDYVQVDGTSVAAAHVAGAAALLLHARPAWRHDTIKAALMATARTTGVTEAGGASPTSLFARGAGAVDVATAAQARLVFEPASLSVIGLLPGEARSVPVTLRDVRTGGGSVTYALSTWQGAGLTVTGDAQVSLAAGASKVITLTLRVDGDLSPRELHAEVTLSGGGGQSHLPIWVHTVPRLASAQVLLIDNDFSNFEAYNNYAPIISQALNAAGISHSVWDADIRYAIPQSLPDLASLQAYRAIIWLTGDNTRPDGYYTLSTPLTKQDLRTLAAYLDSGGRLLALGQNLAEASDVNPDADPTWGRADLYHGYLGARWLQSSLWDPQGQGLYPPQDGPAVIGLPGTFLAGMQLNLGRLGDGAGNQTSVDEVAPGGVRDGADVGLVTPLMVAVNGVPLGEGYVALAKSDQPSFDRATLAIPYRTVYLAFGPEGINTVAGLGTRSELLQRSLAWLLDEASVSLPGPLFSSVNTLTQFTCQPASSHGGAAFNYRWRIGSGAGAVVVESATPSISHSFGASGVYPLAVEVTDALGHKAVAYTTVTVTQGGSSALTASAQAVAAGGEIIYTVTVRNTDPSSLSSRFTLPLPANTTYLTHQGGTYAQGKLTWTGSLPSHESYVARLHVRVPPGTRIGTEIVATADFVVGNSSFQREARSVVTAPAFLPLVIKHR
jgi:uncharacterized repeat protein (TIGR01451 family)